MTYRTETGQFGEDLAVKHLENKGFTIIERNFRRKWGELDIIAKFKDKTLVFVEVKTMRQNNEAIAGLLPEEQLTKAKLTKLQRTASLYVGDHQDLVTENKGWRIDLIAITIKESGDYNLNHYENL